MEGRFNGVALGVGDAPEVREDVGDLGAALAPALELEGAAAGLEDGVLELRDLLALRERLGEGLAIELLEDGLVVEEFEVGRAAGHAEEDHPFGLHGQVRLLAADAIDSLPADLFKELPGVAAQAAALRLPLDVAAALGDTEEERAAADVLASQSASFEAANAQLAAAAVQSPQELARAREALASAPAQSPSDAAAYAAREREADAALRAATTITAFRLAQARQLIVRKILFSRFDALVRGAGVSDAFARLFSGQRLEEFKLAQAESAARFALRHNGQEPADRLLGATRALAAAITALVAERAERDKLERALSELFGDAEIGRAHV